MDILSVRLLIIFLKPKNMILDVVKEKYLKIKNYYFLSADRDLSELKKMNKTMNEYYNACKEGNLEIVKIFLNNKQFNVNKQNKDGFTDFHYACLHGNLEIVKTFLNDKQFDVNKQNKDGIPGFI